MKKINQFVIGSIILVSAAVLADDHEMFAGDLNPADQCRSRPIFAPSMMVYQLTIMQLFSKGIRNGH